MTLYKVLDKDGRSCNGGGYQWPKPNGNAGKWTPTIKNIVPCARGYHLTDAAYLLDWISADDRTVWVAEGRGEHQDAGEKQVFGSARLVRQVQTINPRTLRLFSCLCAEHVLPFFEAKYPRDDRLRNAIAVARRFADGQATRDELAAARSAARSAAWYAAGAAAGSAARYAARDAARAAAGSAGGWAARDAAGAAARDAAGAAARAAAGWAAWDAARDAEREWQTARLIELLEAE